MLETCCLNRKKFWFKIAIKGGQLYWDHLELQITVGIECIIRCGVAVSGELALRISELRFKNYICGSYGAINQDIMVDLLKCW